MRLLVDSDLGLGGRGAGVAVETMRWLRPVRPVMGWCGGC